MCFALWSFFFLKSLPLFNHIVIHAHNISSIINMVILIMVLTIRASWKSQRKVTYEVVLIAFQG